MANNNITKQEFNEGIERVIKEVTQKVITESRQFTEDTAQKVIAESRQFTEDTAQKVITESRQFTEDTAQKVMEKSNKSTEDLAKMIKEGFDGVDNEIKLLKQGQYKLEQGQEKLEQGQEEIKMRLGNKADKFEVTDLTKRVMRIEDIVLRRRRLASKF